MKRSDRVPVISTITMAFVVLLLGAVVVFSALSTPTASAARETGDGEDSIQILAEPRSNQDLVPDKFRIDEGVRASSMYLGKEGSASFWAGVGSEGTLCLLVGFDGPMTVAARSCVESDVFNEQGLGLRANTVDGAIVAYLVPDEFIGAESGQHLRSIHPNLLVGDPLQAGQSTETLTAPNGSIVELPGFGELGDYQE